MTVKLIAVLNREIPLSKVLNGLAHMTFGMGHRLAGEPDVQVVFGSTAQVREFRTRASRLHASQKDSSIFTDFPHTMVGMSTGDLLANVASTPEADVTYFGSCFVSEEIDPSLSEIVQVCTQLKDYAAHSSQTPAHLLAAQTPLENSTEPSSMKISMLFNSKHSLAKGLNAAVLGSLHLGSTVPHNQQRLLNVAGSGEGAYGLTNISFHSLVVVTTGKHYDPMSTTVKTSTKLTSNGNEFVTVAYGTRTDVEAIITPKSTRLYANELVKEADLVALAPVVSNAEKSSPAASPPRASNVLFEKPTVVDATAADVAASDDVVAQTARLGLANRS